MTLLEIKILEMDKDSGEDIIFKNNPIYMKSLIGKKVQIEMVDDEIYTGIIYVIDPVFKHVVLHEKLASDLLNTRLILYPAIKSLTVLSDEQITSYTQETVLPKVSQNKEKMKSKKEMKKLLINMGLNVEESGDCLKIDDNLVLIPPYGPDNCISNNTLILERVQNIIKNCDIKDE